MKVYVHLATGFEEVEALTVVDVLRRGKIGVETVSVTGERTVIGAHDIPVMADLLIEDGDYDSCDMMVFPGGLPGTTNLADHEGLLRHLRDFMEAGKWLVAICAAPIIFGELGLLDGRKAVCYPGMERHLYGADIQNTNVVVDGNYITSKGPATAMEFALKLVEVLAGENAAKEVAKGLLLELE